MIATIQGSILSCPQFISFLFILANFTTIDYLHCYSRSPFFIANIFNFFQYLVSLHKLPKNYILPVKTMISLKGDDELRT